MNSPEHYAPSIEDVKEFWDSNPLFSGEFDGEVGSREYFEQHEKTIIDDCMAGSFDERFISFLESGRSILDVGCGPGFWVRQFCRMGLRVYACDLSTTAVELTKKSLKLFDFEAEVREGNAEKLPYRDESFDYINCQGVIHHTPNTEKCIAEFSRVLKPGGVVCFSVYHRNVILRSPFLLKILVGIFGGRIGLRGRGRENVFKDSDVNDIVRIYDGKDNPIGKSYTVDEILTMMRSQNLILVRRWHHNFPARAFPFRIPRSIHKFLDAQFGLLIVFLARKPGKEPAFLEVGVCGISKE